MLPPEPRLPGISVREAAIRLGTSESDIRRRIRRGELQAEVLPRAGGTLLRVLLPDPTDAPGAAPAESGAAPEAPQDAPALTTRLLDKLDERDVTITALHAENAELRERVGRAETEAAAAERRATDLAAELARERGRRWWRFWE